MTMQELQDQRPEFVQGVQNAVTEDLTKNGLELESVSLTSLDQTGKEFFNPNNAFDAEGLTRLTQETENRRRERNEIEQDTEVAVRQKNLDAEQQKLEIQRQEQFLKLEQEQQIKFRTADLTYGVPLASAEELTAVGQAYLDAGIRAVLAPMIADITFYKAIPGLFDALPEHLQAAVSAPDGGADLVLGPMRAALHGWSHDRERVRLGIAPTIPLLCSDALIVGSAALAKEYDTVLQSHVAESKVQAVSALKRWGKSLTAHIDELGLLGPNFSVAHGVWLDDDDMRRLADHGASVAAQCRQQHAARLRHRGCAPHARARRHARDRHRRGVMLGQPEHVRGDALRLARLERARPGLSPLADHAGDHSRRDRRRRRARPVSSRSARIAKGYKADIVFVNLASVNWMPVNDPANQLVLTEDATGVLHVMVGGEMMVENGAHRSCD